MIISKLEEILRPHIPANEQEGLNLSANDCVYRAFYFNNIPESSAKDAIGLFPDSEQLWSNYKKITTNTEILTSSELCDVVYDYLKSVALIMEKENRAENKDALNFINNLERSLVIESDKFETFTPKRNELHSFSYGTLANFIIDELPEDKAYWVLYDWAIEQGHVATDACFLLQKYFESGWFSDVPIFDAALKLHQSGNFNRYWVEGNSFHGSERRVLCNAVNL